MRDKLEALDTRFDMMTLLLDALHAVIHDTPLNTGPITDDLQEAYTAQEAIGWDNLLKGHLAKQLQHLQQKQLGDNATKKNNGVTWATNFIDMAYQQFFKAWFLRNGSDMDMMPRPKPTPTNVRPS